MTDEAPRVPSIKLEKETLVDIPLSITPFLVLVLSIVLLVSKEIEAGGLLTFFYITVIITESLRSYKKVTGFAVPESIGGRSTLGLIWLDKSFHQVLVALVFLSLSLAFRLYFISQLIYAVIAVGVILKVQIGSRVEALRQPLTNLSDFLENTPWIGRAAGLAEILLVFWILFRGLAKFNSIVLLAFLLYFFLLTLYGEACLAVHHNLYHDTADFVVKNLPAAKQASVVFDPLISLAKAIYPLGTLEKYKD
jgi:hypothetical protein